MAQNKKTNGRKRFPDKAGKGRLNRKPSGVKKDKAGEYTGEPANNPGYYTVNPVLAALTSAIPVNPVIGTDPVWSKTWGLTNAPNGVLNFPRHAHRIPGAMGISLIPAFGSDMNSMGAPSASFNRLCANLYAVLVRDKSGTAPFDQAAVGHYLACMRSAYIVVHDLKRFLSLVTYYQAGNRYMPKGLAGAVGRINFSMSPEDLDAAMWEVNNLVKFLNTKYVPKMPVFARDYDLYSRFYADSQTEYAQMYAFYPRGYYLWDDANNTSVFTPFSTADLPALPDTVLSISMVCQNIIQSINNSDMFNIITSWFRHVTTPGESWQLEDGPIPPAPTFVYDEYILSQIENMTVVKTDPSNYSGLNLIQSGANNYLEYANITTGLAAAATEYNVGLACNPVFNFHVTIPDDKLKLESSRLCVCAREEQIQVSTDGEALESTVVDFIFSDQIPVMINICGVGVTYGNLDSVSVYSRVGMVNGKYGNRVGVLAYTVPMVSMFKHHPFIWATRAQLNSSGDIQWTTMAPIGDVDTTASLDKDAFNRLSYTCTYSLFSIPGITS